VQTKLPGRLGVHDRFVRPIRIGEAALYESDAVLGRVLPVEAAENCWGCLADVQLVMDSLNPVEVDVAIEDDRGRRVLDKAKMRDRLEDSRAVPGGETQGRIVNRAEEPDGGWVGTSQVDGKGRVRPPGPRHGTHGDPTDQADQQDHAQVATPTAANVARKRYQATRRSSFI